MDLHGTTVIKYWTISVLLSRYSDRLQAGQPGFDSRQAQEIFLYSTTLTPALGPSQSPIQWIPRAVSSDKAAGE
jgi:hypothetical protein